MTFRFLLSTPDKTYFNGPAESVMCPGTEGYFGILPRHAQMVAAVGLGVITVLADGKTSFFVVDGGVAEVTPEEMILVADLAIAVKDPGDAEEKILEIKANRATPVTIH